MSDSVFFTSLSKAGSILGRGLVAGLAGTLAITISQIVEMQLTKRGNSDAPMKVAGKTLGVEPRGKAALEKEKQQKDNDKEEEKLEQTVEDNKGKFSQIVHYAYGTGWGIPRGVLDAAGLRGAPATLVHFGAVWGTEQIMLPAAGASKPITKWSPQQIATDALHHAVYAIAAGAVYDAMPAPNWKKTSTWTIF
jgi:hypothetical protein